METKGSIHRYGLRVFLAKTAFGGTERVHVNGVRAEQQWSQVVFLIETLAEQQQQQQVAVTVCDENHGSDDADDDNDKE